LRRIEGVAVKLEHDEINESARHLDKYGRILAYVYAYAFAKVKEGLAPDGVSEKWSDDNSKGNVLHLMNAKLVANGYCPVYTRFDFPPEDVADPPLAGKHKDKFLELEAEARKEGRGMWG